MSIAVFSEIYPLIQTALVDNVVGRFGAFMAIAQPVVLSGLGIYFAVYGFAVIRGHVAAPARDLVVKTSLFAVGFWAATSFYGDIASAVTEGLPNQFAAAAGGTSGDIGQIFDRMLIRADGEIAEIEETVERETREYSGLDFYKAIPTQLSGMIAILLISLGSLIATIAGFIVSMVAVFALALLAAVGPLFVLAGIFDQTRQFMFGWIAAVVNYLMLLVITILVVAAVNAVVATLNTDFSDSVLFFREALIVVAIYGLGILLFVQTPAIAASLGGGAGAAINGAIVGVGGRLGIQAGRAAGRGAGFSMQTIGAGASATGRAGTRAIGRARATSAGRALVRGNR